MSDKVKTPKLRCDVCSKKLGLIVFECKCGKKTCTSHRGVNHECEYNYYNEHQNELENKLKIIFKKIEI
jgi:hypothetical protein